MGTRRYTRRIADAKWIKCEVCGGQSAMSIRVECQGRYGRKGSRSLGCYCEEHGKSRLNELIQKSITE